MTLYAALSNTYVNEQWRGNVADLYETVAFRNVIGADKRLQTSGVAFARKAHTSAMLEKNRARWRVIEAVSRGQWPNKLRMLTMPGLEWTFENLLLAQRDYDLHSDSWHAHQYSNGHFVGDKLATEFYCVERDPAIYFAALKYIPAKRKGFEQLSPHSIRTKRINLYYFTDVETFIGDPNCPAADAAWLDFTGYMIPARLSRIRRFWREKCGSLLAITVLNARYPHHVRCKVQEFGSMTAWIAETLGGTLIDEYPYYDEHSAMLQLILRR